MALLAGKTAFVTGGASGIGAATALAFAREGARVAVADRADPASVVAAITAAGGEAYCAVLDVTDEAAVNAAVDDLVARWGRIDIGFNNAGVSVQRMGSEWGDTEPYDREVAINQRGMLLSMRAELRHMARAGSGSIINTSSVAGQTGITGAGYAASKHAVIGLTRSAAMAYAEQGIRVNCICPGAIETPMTQIDAQGEEARRFMAAMQPMNRLGQADEVANAVVFLASDMASFITGHPLAVDGGFLAR